MAESVSIKAYLKRDGQEVEVRRFVVDGRNATSWTYIQAKIQTMFPSIQQNQFQVFWQDNDKDYIRVDSDEELFEAFTASNQQPLKIYIQIQSNSNAQGGATAGPSNQQTHPRVVCDGCEGPVVGFRYKCVTCPDFDLCSRCESNGLHNEHFMLRMPTPMDNLLHHPKFLRKLFSHPHKFNRRHGWGRPSPPRGCGDSQNGAGRCPFTRRGDAAAAFAGVTDMFDFSALMDFIESLGVATGEERPAQSASAGAGASASAEATASATTSSATNASSTANAPRATNAPSGSQSAPHESPRPQSSRRSSTPAAEYLNNIGQMVAAILDPLGVDVTFDVRTKAAQAEQQQQQQATPTPTPPTTAATTSAPAPAATTSASAPATAAPAPAPAPAATIETQTEPTRERRDSGEWLLINRESPTRGEAIAMDVDESRGAKPRTPPPPPAAETSTPSAPPQADDLSDNERQKIQEAIDTFRSMGFDFNTNILRELLKRQNCDMLSVLEMMLNAEKK